MPHLFDGPRLAVLLSVALASTALAQPAPTPHLSLNQALVEASRADPSLAAQAARRSAGEAAVRQAAAKPNAALSLEVENLAGSGVYSLFDRSETTLAYEQTLERGGKREARTSRARAELAAVELRAETRRLDVLRDTQLAYGDVLATEAELLIAEARLISAQRSQADVGRRVRSARDPLFAGSRAEALTAQAEIGRDRARDAALAAKAALAAYLGRDPRFSVAVEDFFNVTPPTPVTVDEAPDLALLEAERDVAAATVRVETARTTADPTLRAGVRYFGEGSEVALVVGGSLPLGVRKTGQWSVERAQAERQAAQRDIAAARLLRQREAIRLAARMTALVTESDRIRDEVIPHATRTVEQVLAGFNRGGFEYLDVTEAERLLAETRARRVEVLRDYHKTKAELDRLTGEHRAKLKELR
jgi:cobalt-zinc-cadmium efflux system outer membrane protein